MRIIREVEAGGGVGRVSADIDPERTDLPVAGNRAHQEEHRDQAAEEQQEPEPPPPATLRLLSWQRYEADRHQGGDGLAGYHDRFCDGFCDGFRDGFRDGFHDGFRDGFGRRRRGRGEGILDSRLRLSGIGQDRRRRLGWRGSTGQPGKPLVQLCLIGRRGRIRRLGATPGD